MKSEEAEEADQSAEDASLEQVADPEAFNQQKRLREIHDARRNFHDRRQSAADLKTGGDINHRQYTDLLLKAFQRYFFELEGLMYRHGRGEHYLEDVELGKIEPAGEEEEEEEEEDPIEFEGLRSLAGNIPAVPVDGIALDDQRGSTKDQRVLTVASEDIIMTGFRKCNQFLAEAGLDAEMEEGDDEAEADYSDILED